MKENSILRSMLKSVKKNGMPFILENRKIIFQFIFTLFFIGIGIWFIKHEGAEIGDLKNAITKSKRSWVIAGMLLTVIYILLQSLMYVASFASVNCSVTLKNSISLFLKRNFISVFLPAGGISSLTFFTDSFKKKGIKGTQIFFASVIYGFVGILSVVIVAIPLFIYALINGTIGSNEGLAILGIIALLTILILVYQSILKEGWIYKWMIKSFPFAKIFMNDLKDNKINKENFIVTILYSILIEFTGIVTLYVSMIALNFSPSIYAAMLAYLVSVIFLIVSPFLKGLGAVEVSMSLVLIRFGFNSFEAISITFLYRLFEFWIPLLAGVLPFLLQMNKVIIRIVPALLLLLLGIINIISVLTPAISNRIKWLQDFIPIHAMNASNYFVVIIGLLLLVTAAFMLKGLRTAWWLAIALSSFSVLGHLIKAFDFEEAIFAFLVIIILIITRKEYYIKTNPYLRNVGLQTSILSILATMIYGTIGFYFLDSKHFNINFNWIQSIHYTLDNYFLIRSSNLIPTDNFSKEFLYSLNISGFLSMGFLFYTLVQPYVIKSNSAKEEIQKAKDLVQKYGNSGLDYFKIYFDKMIFIPPNSRSFISYRISGNIAVVLENPIAENLEEMKYCIRSFDTFCYENSLKNIYYRVKKEVLEVYHEQGKKDLFIGQEAIVDLAEFNLEGRSKKSLRNALKKINVHKLKSAVYCPPIKDGLLQKIKAVSDEWLEDTDRKEIIFSQGMFIWEELKHQTIITVENDEEKIIAFLNIIPDYKKGEETYDLMRKTKDAPNGTMDFLMIALFNYLKSKNFSTINLGFAPMSGLNDPHDFQEKTIRFAYEKIRSFSHYKGLREFKDKFSPIWLNNYMIYQHDYDLLKAPIALSKVIKP
jgi:phosphatidylglycerol lysyltransferase